MTARVTDASVVAAWCYDEPRAREAAALMERSNLYAPLLLAHELTSIARRKATVYSQQREVIVEALQTALALPIHWIAVDHAGVLRLALDANLSTCDASYLFLAQALGASLATFDQRLAQAARNLGA